VKNASSFVSFCRSVCAISPAPYSQGLSSNNIYVDDQCPPHLPSHVCWKQSACDGHVFKCTVCSDSRPLKCTVCSDPRPLSLPSLVLPPSFPLFLPPFLIPLSLTVTASSVEYVMTNLQAVPTRTQLVSRASLPVSMSVYLFVPVCVCMWRGRICSRITRTEVEPISRDFTLTRTPTSAGLDVNCSDPRNMCDL
jgi:hypothetical protein